MNNFSDYIDKLKEVDLPAWQNGQKSFLSSLFDLMNQADKPNRYKLGNAYPLEMQAFLEFIDGLAK